MTEATTSCPGGLAYCWEASGRFEIDLAPFTTEFNENIALHWSMCIDGMHANDNCQIQFTTSGGAIGYTPAATLSNTAAISDQIFAFGTSADRNTNGIRIRLAGFPFKTNKAQTCRFNELSVTGDPIPTQSPTKYPTTLPTLSPTNPTQQPSVSPTTQIPSTSPTTATANPTQLPSITPTKYPTNVPSTTPSKAPSNVPSIPPTKYPSITPTVTTDLPTKAPSRTPSMTPSSAPSPRPTFYIFIRPTHSPSPGPTPKPTPSPKKNIGKQAMHVIKGKGGDRDTAGLIFIIVSAAALVILCVLCVICVRKHGKERKEWTNPTPQNYGPSYTPEGDDFEITKTGDVKEEAERGCKVTKLPVHITANKWKSAWELETERQKQLQADGGAVQTGAPNTEGRVFSDSDNPDPVEEEISDETTDEEEDEHPQVHDPHPVAQGGNTPIRIPPQGMGFNPQQPYDLQQPYDGQQQQYGVPPQGHDPQQQQQGGLPVEQWEPIDAAAQDALMEEASSLDVDGRAAVTTGMFPMKFQFVPEQQQPYGMAPQGGQMGQGMGYDPQPQQAYGAPPQVMGYEQYAPLGQQSPQSPSVIYDEFGNQLNPQYPD
eukprot:144005_1